MKKIIFAIFAASLLFVQCDPEKEKNKEGEWNGDGVYQPAKKISKIYVQNNYYAKRLSEEWIWSDNNLSQVILDSGESITYHFSYDDKDRVTKMYGSDGWVRLEFSYDDKGIKRVEAYEENVLVSFADCSHSNNKISKITLTVDWNNINSTNAVEMLSFIVPPQAINILKAKSKQKIATPSTISMNFTWVNDNIEKIEYFDNIEGVETSTGTIAYQYDNKNNPHKNFAAGFFFRIYKSGFLGINPSNNNVISIKESLLSGGSEETERSIKYNEDDYPVEITTEETGQEEYAYTIFYEYK
jgi:hypothetical protein